MLSPGGARGVEGLNSTGTLIQTTTTEAPHRTYVLHWPGCSQKTISYCVKDASGQTHREGKIGVSRLELDAWIGALPQPRVVAMEATIFTGWIYDDLLPHAEPCSLGHWR
jgi:hypothetical protein